MQLEITGIAPGGFGFGESPVGRIYVRDTIPGDHVEIGRRRTERGTIRADVVKRVSRRSKQREAPCQHFGRCGGCDWMDLPYEQQLELKQAMVVEAFRSQDLPAPIADVLGSPEEFRYRNRVDFAFENSETGVKIGLYEKGDPKDRSHQMPPLCEVKDCWIASEDANAARTVVERQLEGSRLRAYNPVTRAGVLRGLDIRSGQDGLSIGLSVANDKHVPVDEIASGLKESDVQVGNFTVRVGRSRSKHAAPKKIVSAFGDSGQATQVLGKRISYSAGVFRQVNSLQMDRLYQSAMEMAGIRMGDQVIDLYCGVGTLSVAVAEHAESVVGVEVDAAAIEDAQKNAADNDLTNCTFACADAGNLAAWGQPLQRFSLVMANPPRAGLSPEVIEGIAATRADRVVYVSCNPDTLARDCKRLCAHNYQVSAVQPVDMFPQTTHVEAIVKMERLGRG
jgi:23S rRNA (uracil1939-C5)-methyltransferase